MGGEILTQRRRDAECAKGSWKLVRLGELCSKIGSGATPSGGKNAYREDGISLIRSQNVLDFSFSTNGLAFINEEQARKLDGVTVKPKDVLLNITGDSVARVCIVPDSVLPARVNQHVCILRPRENVLDSGFLAATLISIKQQLLLMAGSGATRNALTKGDISELKISLPPLPTQRKIAAVLGALDDKIENNRKICVNLEAQAQAIFKSWFVDFEPFGGKMPQGWKMGKLGDVAECNKDSYTSKEGWSFTNYLDTGSITRNQIQDIQQMRMSEAPSRARRKVQRLSIVYSTVRPNQCHYGILHEIKENMLVSTGFAVIDAKDAISSYRLFLDLTQDCVTKQFQTLAEQSVCTYPAINPADILAHKVVIPSLTVEQEFYSIVSQMFEKIDLANQESRSLAATRDALLPKLMSGEIDVEKVEVA